MSEAIETTTLDGGSERVRVDYALLVHRNNRFRLMYGIRACVCVRSFSKEIFVENCKPTTSETVCLQWLAYERDRALYVYVCVRLRNET